MRLASAIQEFLLSYQGSRAPSTITWYRRRLSDLAGFLGESGDVGAVTVSDLRRFRAALEQRGLSVRTRHGYVRAIRHFWKWLVDEGVLVSNVASRLELPKLPKGDVKGILPADIRKMLAASTSRPRDLALVWTFYSTAARLGGIVGLRLSDLDLSAGSARVTEKFNKTRDVWLLPGAIEALRGYLAVRPDSPDDHVFLGKRGALTGSGVYQSLKAIAERAGVGAGWNPHSFRHRRARDLLAARTPLGTVSQILGHSGVQVTADIYGVLDREVLQDASNRVELPVFR